MLPDDRLWAVVWQHNPQLAVLETGAPFDDKFEPFLTYGDLNLRGWMVVPLTEDLDNQLREYGVNLMKSYAILKAIDRSVCVQLNGTFTAYELRHWAAARWAVDPQSVTAKFFDSSGPEVFIVELRWSGDDYAHGGTPKGRRLQVRGPKGKWRNA